MSEQLDQLGEHELEFGRLRVDRGGPRRGGMGLRVELGAAATRLCLGGAYEGVERRGKGEGER